MQRKTSRQGQLSTGAALNRVLKRPPQMSYTTCHHLEQRALNLSACLHCKGCWCGHHVLTFVILVPPPEPCSSASLPPPSPPADLQELLQSVFTGWDDGLPMHRDLLDCCRQQLLEPVLDNGKLQHLVKQGVQGEQGGRGKRPRAGLVAALKQACCRCRTSCVWVLPLLVPHWDLQARHA